MLRKISEMREQNLPIWKVELFDRLCSTTVLKEGFKAVKRNKGAPGIDGITTKVFEANLEEEISSLKKDLEEWTYEPRPVKRVEIPKPSGGKRLLGIPCVRDRVVQATIKALVEPIFEQQFSRHSYGFRPGLGPKNAVQAAREIAESGKEYVVDIDLEKFFDKINHDRLISRMSKNISDKRILRVIGKNLRSGIMADGLVRSSQEGAVQGSPLSPLLSNIVLDELDKELEQRGLEFCRYADDCNIFAKSKESAEKAMRSISEFIETRLKLTVNKEKSKAAKSSSVKFLGFTIVAATIAISLAAMGTAMAQVERLTQRGTNQTLKQSVNKINRWYTGWSAYFGMTQYPAQLGKIEAHIRRRLRARIVKQQKSKRNLARNLVKRGVSWQSARTVYRNRNTWHLSHTRAVERGYPNRWFSEEIGLKIRSNEKRPHWFDVRHWVKLT